LFLDTVEKCFLTQHVKCLTTDISVLDSKDPDLVYNVQVLAILRKVIMSFYAVILTLPKRRKTALKSDNTTITKWTQLEQERNLVQSIGRKC